MVTPDLYWVPSRSSRTNQPQVSSFYHPIKGSWFTSEPAGLQSTKVHRLCTSNLQPLEPKQGGSELLTTRLPPTAVFAPLCCSLGKLFYCLFIELSSSAVHRASLYVLSPSKQRKKQEEKILTLCLIPSCRKPFYGGLSVFPDSKLVKACTIQI